MNFDFTLVPMVEKGARLFVKAGPSTKFNRGFRNRKELDHWFDEMMELNVLDWRVGGLFRVRGVNEDLWIVNKRGEPL